MARLRFDLAPGDNLDRASGFAGRDLLRWSRRMIALGRKPPPLRTYDLMVEGDDVHVELRRTLCLTTTMGRFALAQAGPETDERAIASSRRRG